jgi:hypothetical protein
MNAMLFSEERMGMTEVVAMGGGCNKYRYIIRCYDEMTKVITIPEGMTIYW